MFKHLITNLDDPSASAEDIAKVFEQTIRALAIQPGLNLIRSKRPDLAPAIEERISFCVVLCSAARQ